LPVLPLWYQVGHKPGILAAFSHTAADWWLVMARWSQLDELVSVRRSAQCIPSAVEIPRAIQAAGGGQRPRGIADEYRSQRRTRGR